MYSIIGCFSIGYYVKLGIMALHFLVLGTLSFGNMSRHRRKCINLRRSPECGKSLSSSKEHWKTWSLIVSEPLKNLLSKPPKTTFTFHLEYNFEPFWKYGSKILLWNGCDFLPDVCQLRSGQHQHFCSHENVKLFFHQIVAILLEKGTGLETILKTFKTWIFWRKKLDFFRKNPSNFSELLLKANIF